MEKDCIILKKLQKAELFTAVLIKVSASMRKEKMLGGQKIIKTTNILDTVKYIDGLKAIIFDMDAVSYTHLSPVFHYVEQRRDCRTGIHCCGLWRNVYSSDHWYEIPEH